VPALNPGDRLGRFRILEPLGAGGMGEVYRARDERLERDVAIKVLPKDTFSGEAGRDRFHTEARALARLSHPHIGQVHDFASEAGVDYLVMELVRGRSLARQLEDGPLPEHEVLKFGLELASALEAAHAAGVVHRDLKPGNLMITESGALKVLDFGLAKILHPDRPKDVTLTMDDTETVSGTLPYMAPEQLLGETVDARTDIWAAGVVLYEMAAGRRPFDEKIGTRLTHAILTQSPEALAKAAPGVSAGLGQIIMKCLEKAPDRRYPSAADLRSDLERLSVSGTVKVSTALGRRSGSRTAQRIMVIAAVLALAGLMAIWRPWRAGPAGRASATPIKSLAVLPLDNLTGDASQEYFSDGMTEALITELWKVRSLKVISRKSVMPFKKSTQSLPEIAKQLGVEGVVTGSVERASGRVRVTVQLIRAASDENLWADTFDRGETDVLALHTEIAQAIARQVRAIVTPEEVRSLQSARKVNPEAYDLALRADYLTVNASGPEDVERAVDLAQKAVAIDSSWAAAYASLAGALNSLTAFGVKTGREVLPLLRAAADRAVELDGSLAAAHVARYYALLVAFDWENAGREARKAVELAPNDGNARGNYGYWLALMGRTAEAEKESRQAIESDPLNLANRCNLMNILYALRRDEEAVAVASDILGLNPSWFWAHNNLSSIAFLQGRPAEALAQAEKAWKIVWKDFPSVQGMAWGAYVRWIPEELKRRDGKPWRMTGFIAAAYAMFGDKEKAIPYLERSIDDGDAWTAQLFWPEFDGLRGDPRFLAVVRKMNLPVDVYRRPYRELAAPGPR
jgi:serine/threonine protein kinase/tetratricopeptide (TPR) repeat protein